MVGSSHVPKGDVAALYNGFQKTKENYTPWMCRQEHLSEMPDLCIFMTSLVSLIPYSTWVVKAWDLILEELVMKSWTACG